VAIGIAVSFGLQASMAVLPTMLGPLAPQHLLDVLGVAGVFLILFAETGLLVGIILPGDSLLFVAGYATVPGNDLPGHLHLPLGWLLLAAAAGAIIGAQVGFELGRRVGPALFRRPRSLLFKPEYVERTRAVVDQFGPARAVVLARFVPIVRTLLNPMVGLTGMAVGVFTLWNVVGGLLWTVGLILLGHGVGNVDFVRTHIEVLAVGVVLLSVGPLLFEMTRRTRANRRARVR
jgi:membrane-associated protein